MIEPWFSSPFSFYFAGKLYLCGAARLRGGLMNFFPQKTEVDYNNEQLHFASLGGVAQFDAHQAH